ncbi:MAG: bifunctional metallophosphatase/5'-nucleotidase [Gemmatimonadota bacterium]
MGRSRGGWAGLLRTGLAMLATGCATAPPAAVAPRDGRVDIVFLHLNDVYEITPVEGGRAGGLGRVATLRERWAAQEPVLVTTFGGDLLSPSAMGTARVDGERLAGAQMVAVMNAVGLDLAVLGNHEFDVPETSFRARLAESRFQWLAANVTDSLGRPFPGVRPWVVRTVGDAQGDTVRIAFVGAVLPDGAPDWVRVGPARSTLEAAAALLADSADAVVALTHQTVAEDRALLAAVPGIALVLGGHDHHAMHVQVDGRSVVKADANAVTVARVPFAVGRSGSRTGPVEHVPVTDAIPEQPTTAGVVGDWVERAFAGFRVAGFEPERRVASVAEDLDGLEASVRTGPTALTVLIGEAMRAQDPDADVALYNAGSIRFDDVLRAGPVTEYDVIRVLPYGGTTFSVRMRGDVLRRTLEQGERNRATPAFLQGVGVARAGEGWTVGGAALAEDRWYRVVLPDFLLTGRERGLAFLRSGSEGLEVLEEHADIRRAVIAELERRPER